MRIATFRTACLLAVATALSAPLAATLGQVEQVMGRDGLQPIQVKDIDLAYAKPGATLAPYKRIKLDAAEVEFSRFWNPERTGSRLKMSTQERQDIKAALAAIVQDEFAKGLQAGGSYQVATESGPDVLVVKPRLINVYLNAPDAGNAARTRTFVSTAGEMTLVAELSDSRSGEVLVRLADRRESTTTGNKPGRIDGMVNENEARRITSDWARILRRSLDRAQGGGS